MKAIPILVITNAVALGLGLMAYLELDDVKSQRGAMRQTSSREGAQGDDHTQEVVQDLRGQIARLQAKVDTLSAETSGAVGAPASADAEGGKAIDRSYPVPAEFAEETELARPDFEYFRERVRLAQDANEKEERLNQQIDRLDSLITENRIGPLSDGQKKKAAEILLDTREKSRLIFRGLRERQELQNLPREQQREAWRTAFQKERDSINSAAQKSLEELMPAADAETLMASSGRDFGGAAPRAPRGNRGGR